MREAVDSFLNHLVVEKGFSRNTLEAYKNDLYQFIGYVNGRPPGETSQNGDLPLESKGTVGWRQVDLDILTSYVSSLRVKKSYRDTTTARKVAALKSFFNFLIQEDMLTDVPYRWDVVKSHLKTQDGHWLPTEVPGLGIEVDEEEAAKHPFKQEVIHPMTIRAEDNSILDW